MDQQGPDPLFHNAGEGRPPPPASPGDLCRPRWRREGVEGGGGGRDWGGPVALGAIGRDFFFGTRSSGTVPLISYLSLYYYGNSNVEVFST
jgi:hypothetical protein